MDSLEHEGHEAMHEMDAFQFFSFIEGQFTPSSHYVSATKFNNHTHTQIASSFTFSLSSTTRGNSKKLDKSHVSTVRDGHSFTKRIC